MWSVGLSDSPLLASNEGELQSLRISLDPRHLEDLLETLAELSFPINPEIRHQTAGVDRPVTVVEFPAYSSKVGEVRRAVASCGLAPESLTASGVFAG